MGTKRTFLLWIIITGILCSPALGRVEQLWPKGLIGQPNPGFVGLERLSVVIVPPDSEPNKNGMVWKELEIQIAKKLKRAGIKMIPGIAGNILEIPELQICVDTLKLNDPQLYIFHIRTSLAIKVSLENKRKRYLKAVVWKVGSAMQVASAEQMPAAVTKEVCREVDVFISAWRQANRAGGKAGGTVSPTVSEKPRQGPTAKSIEAGHNFIASKNSKVFHKADCSSAKRIKPENLVTYKNREEAVKAGKRACKRCKP